MQRPVTSSQENLLFNALKGLALVAELAMAAGIFYAAATAIRYWPHITV